MHIQLRLAKLLVVKVVALVELAKMVEDVRVLPDKIVVLLVMDEYVVELDDVVVELLVVIVEEIVVLVVVMQVPAHSQSLVQDSPFVHGPPPQPVQDPPLQRITQLIFSIINLFNISIIKINFKMFILRT